MISTDERRSGGPRNLAGLDVDTEAHYPLQLLPAPLELSFTLHLRWHERFDDDSAKTAEGEAEEVSGPA